MTERREYPPGTPGRAAEDVPVDGEAPQPSPDPDRNLTPSGAGEGPGGRAQDPPSQGGSSGGSSQGGSSGGSAQGGSSGGSSQGGSSGGSSQGPPPHGRPSQGGSSQAGGHADTDRSEGRVEADLAERLADAEAKRDEYLDIARRAQADFENYRKRKAAEVQAAALRGKAEVARGVVPVLDDLERAIQAAELDPEGDSEDPLAHGVLLVFRNLRETLGRSGVETVDPKGEKFDPNVHEALSTIQVEGTAAGVVVEVMQKGYRFDGHLIRPAMVVVAA